MNKKVSEEQEYFIFRMGSLGIAAIVFLTIIVAFLWKVRGVPNDNFGESYKEGRVVDGL